MAIKLLITGGTIDKKYDEIDGKLKFAQKSYIKKMLKQGRCRVDIEYKTLFLKDSLEFTDSDREFIYQKCLESKEKRIIITHGTDTMTHSAEYLASKNLDKTVVFIGAMIPYNFKNSDSLFNLGVAIGGIEFLDRGVYVAMNGKVFEYNRVIKNRKFGIFSRLNY